MGEGPQLGTGTGQRRSEPGVVPGDDGRRCGHGERVMTGDLRDPGGHGRIDVGACLLLTSGVYRRLHQVQEAVQEPGNAGGQCARRGHRGRVGVGVLVPPRPQGQQRAVGVHPVQEEAQPPLPGPGPQLFVQGVQSIGLAPARQHEPGMQVMGHPVDVEAPCRRLPGSPLGRAQRALPAAPDHVVPAGDQVEEGAGTPDVLPLQPLEQLRVFTDHVGTDSRPQDQPDGHGLLVGRQGGQRRPQPLGGAVRGAGGVLPHVVAERGERRGLVDVPVQVPPEGVVPGVDGGQDQQAEQRVPQAARFLLGERSQAVQDLGHDHGRGTVVRSLVQLEEGDRELVEDGEVLRHRMPRHLVQETADEVQRSRPPGGEGRGHDPPPHGTRRAFTELSRSAVQPGGLHVAAPLRHLLRGPFEARRRRLVGVHGPGRQVKGALRVVRGQQCGDPQMRLAYRRLRCEFHHARRDQRMAEAELRGRGIHDRQAGTGEFPQQGVVARRTRHVAPGTRKVRPAPGLPEGQPQQPVPRRGREASDACIEHAPEAGADRKVVRQRQHAPADIGVQLERQLGQRERVAPGLVQDAVTHPGLQAGAA